MTTEIEYKTKDGIQSKPTPKPFVHSYVKEKGKLRDQIIIINSHFKNVPLISEKLLQSFFQEILRKKIVKPDDLLLYGLDLSHFILRNL